MATPLYKADVMPVYYAQLLRQIEIIIKSYLFHVLIVVADLSPAKKEKPALYFRILCLCVASFTS